MYATGNLTFLYMNFLVGDLKLVEMTLKLNATIEEDLSDPAIRMLYKEIMYEMVSVLGAIMKTCPCNIQRFLKL